MPDIKCPILLMGRMFSNDPSDISYTSCVEEKCAWWNDRFGMCSQAVDAYLKGQEDWAKTGIELGGEK